MRIPPDIMIEILKITNENHEYQKKLTKEKYNKVMKEYDAHRCVIAYRYYTYPLPLLVMISKYDRKGKKIYNFNIQIIKHYSHSL